jgi:general stress protein CsbA
MPGTAQLSLRYAGGTESYFITGIDKIVPLEAGTLVIPPAAFQSTPVGEESWH